MQCRTRQAWSGWDVQVGVDGKDSALLDAIAERATQEGETCHSEPFKVTALAVKDAMLAADRLGQLWLARTAAMK